MSVFLFVLPPFFTVDLATCHKYVEIRVLVLSKTSAIRPFFPTGISFFGFIFRYHAVHTDFILRCSVGSILIIYSQFFSRTRAGKRDARGELILHNTFARGF